VHEVQDGVEAVEAAARLRPAALVLERILPRLRADEVAERLQAQDATRAVPILLLGTADDPALKTGLFRECLPHPVDRRMLQTALEKLGAPVH
jgi:CheY-like chemotaxis protein